MASDREAAEQALQDGGAQRVSGSINLWTLKVRGVPKPVEVEMFRGSEGPLALYVTFSEAPALLTALSAPADGAADTDVQQAIRFLALLSRQRDSVGLRSLIVKLCARVGWQLDDALFAPAPPAITPADATTPTDALTPPPEHQPEGEPVDDALLSEIRQGFGQRGIQTFTAGKTAGEGIWVTVLGTPKQFRHLLAPDGGALTPQQVERAWYSTLEVALRQGPTFLQVMPSKWEWFKGELLTRLIHSTSDANTGEEGEHG